MFGAIMTQIAIVELAKHHALFGKKSGTNDIAACRPMGRAISARVARFPAAPYRHGNGDHDRDEPARCRDEPSRVEHLRRIRLIGKPPPEQVVRPINRMAPNAEPWLSQLCLKPEGRCRPLRRRPDACQDDECDSQDLAPENFCGGHGIGSCSLRLSQGGARADARVFCVRGKAGEGSEAWAYQPVIHL